MSTLQDYIKESDNLVSLRDQIRDCDSILTQMETLLSGFEACWVLGDFKRSFLFLFSFKLFLHDQDYL